MQIKLLEGILIPFLGTLLGASFVFFMKNEPNKSLEKSLMGFAGGVMMAASIWSLLLPALEQSSSLKKLSFIPAVIGFWTGILFLFSLDKTIPHLHLNSASTEGRKGNFQ